MRLQPETAKLRQFGARRLLIALSASMAAIACEPEPNDVEVGMLLDRACTVTAASTPAPRSDQCGTVTASYSCYRGYSELLSLDSREPLSESDLDVLRQWAGTDQARTGEASLQDATRNLSLPGEDRVFDHYQSLRSAPPCPVSCPSTPWPVEQRTDAVCIKSSNLGQLANRISGVWTDGTSADICLSREVVARVYADCARHWLLNGDAELAQQDIQCLASGAEAGDQVTGSLVCPGGFRGGQAVIGAQFTDTALELAIESWRTASDWGRVFGAQASLVAQQRLQAHTVQCLSSAQSLERLSRIRPSSAGDTIRLSLRQRALNALGHYAGEIDGRYGPATSQAVRSFQREVGYDETGVLTPRQTVLLICHAAQTARDSKIQNTLGIMYSLGLGVEQNTDLALEWLDMAARRDDMDAYFNLAIIYGTGAVLGSYRLCGIIENTDLADAHLAAAARLGHPIAQQWRSSRDYQATDNSSWRWQRIRVELVRAAETQGDVLLQFWQRDHIDPTYLEEISQPCLSAEVLGGRAP